MALCGTGKKKFIHNFPGKTVSKKDAYDRKAVKE